MILTFLHPKDLFSVIGTNPSSCSYTRIFDHPNTHKNCFLFQNHLEKIIEKPNQNMALQRRYSVKFEDIIDEQVNKNFMYKASLEA